MENIYHDHHAHPMDLKECRQTLVEKVSILASTGGRGVELADDIDDLRMITALIPKLRPLKTHKEN